MGIKVGGKGVQQQRDKMPMVQTSSSGGKGVSQQRAAVPHDKRPRIYPRGGGTGVNMQRDNVPRDQRPDIQNQPGGQGVQIQRTTLHGDGILDGSRLRPWFRAIAERLARCIILNRSWEWALTDSVLQQTPSSPKPQVGVFLDPPYRTRRKDGGKRSTGLYQGDNEATSDTVAAATYAWALEHGDR